MEIHPDAQVFPSMADDEYERFADSIEVNGLLEPITLLDGAILDGRHRQKACDDRGITPRYVDWDAACGITPLEWVIACNLHRRSLTTGQRAALAVELEDRLAEAARGRMSEGGKLSRKGRPIRSDQKIPPYGKRSEYSRNRSRYIAAEQFGVGSATVERVKRVRAKDPAVFERVKKGELTTTGAIAEAGLPLTYEVGKRTKQPLGEAIGPLRRYLKNWDPKRLYGMSPPEARKLLKQVQEVDAGLFEVERALEERTVVSRALR